MLYGNVVCIVFLFVVLLRFWCLFGFCVFVVLLWLVVFSPGVSGVSFVVPLFYLFVVPLFVAWWLLCGYCVVVCLVVCLRFVFVFAGSVVGSGVICGGFLIWLFRCFCVSLLFWVVWVVCLGCLLCFVLFGIFCVCFFVWGFCFLRFFVIFGFLLYVFVFIRFYCLFFLLFRVYFWCGFVFVCLPFFVF